MRHPATRRAGLSGESIGPIQAALPLMKASIRDYEPSDEELVVGLSLRAWEPVFAAAEMLGPELFARLRGDWRADLGAGEAGADEGRSGACLD